MPGAAELSNAAAAAGIAEKTGVALDPDYLRQLRIGSETRPVAAVLAAIAEFFGVSASYLTDCDRDPRIDAQLNLLQALRDHPVCDIRVCGPELSPQELNRLAALVAQSG